MSVEIKKLELVCDFVKGNILIFNEKAIFVQDLNEQQNSKLFEEGLKLIYSKVNPNRRNYLNELFNFALPNSNQSPEEVGVQSRKLCSLISLVCDIALHNNKKLAHPDAYHKDFPKYVANLFYQYFLDVSFDLYVKTCTLSFPERMINYGYNFNLI